MLRLVGIDLQAKRIEIALQYIYIGPKLSSDILREAKVDPNVRPKISPPLTLPAFKKSSIPSKSKET
jgi:hypothetical protein